MVLSIFDFLFAPIYLTIIFFISRQIQKKNEQINPLYKYYTRGMFIKLMGAIALCLIYQLYYDGGDTVNYFYTANAISNLLDKSPSVFFDVMMGHNTPENFSFFDESTGYPVYWENKAAFFVCLLIVPITFLGFKSFIATAILMGSICYSGVWKLFLLFNEQFPDLKKQFAISILFIPSVVFWGSGLLKDTITLSAVGWYTYNFYYFFIKKKYKLGYGFAIIVSSYLLISIKPYIFFALVPGSIIWLSNQRLVNVRSKLIRIIVAPLFLVIGIGLGIFVLGQMGDSLGVYAIDKVLDKALESNLDQNRNPHRPTG